MKLRQWTCPNCSKAFEMTEPVFIQGCTGYSTPIHECGEGFCAFQLTPMSEDAKRTWGGIVEHFGLKPGQGEGGA
jgi:hypothetical protein